VAGAAVAQNRLDALEFIGHGHLDRYWVIRAVPCLLPTRLADWSEVGEVVEWPSVGFVASAQDRPVVQALGLGLNRRKGVCRTRHDLLDELSDVIITAAVAMSAVAGGGADEARSHFEHRLGIVTARTAPP